MHSWCPWRRSRARRAAAPARTRAVGPLTRWLPWLLALLAVLALSLPSHAVARAAPLDVGDSAAVALWPAVTLLVDPAGDVGIDQALARRDRFTAPTGTPGNLGRSAQTVWLRIPLRVAGDAPVERVLDLDYAPLNRVDLYLVRDGAVVSHQRMGNALAPGERSWATRAPAAPLRLEPGEQDVLLRVQTQSSMVLPLTLRTHEGYAGHEAGVQLVQGALLGLAAWMLLYSLLHCFSLRDAMFLDYALMLTGNALYTLSYFGIGAEYLWPGWPQLSTRLAPMAILLAVAACTRFVDAALRVDEVSRTVARVLRLVRWTAAAGLAAALCGVLDYRAAQALVTVLGVAVPALVLPVAWVRARRGERVAVYMLGGWAVYAVGVVWTAGLLRGHIEPGFWGQHLYAFSSMAEMATWMAVLGLRVQTIHREADRARVETEALRALAQTDALTGLPNRRGLHEHLARGLQRCTPQQLLAVYLLDLDGFKPVNDRYGHDVGDALLVAVGQRLQRQLRGSDLVARLGGDEFVVLPTACPTRRPRRRWARSCWRPSRRRSTPPASRAAWA